MRELQIDSERRGDATILSPKGDVDLASAPTLRRSLSESLNGKPSRLVLDLDAVAYMDSSGVATLIEAMQIARRSGTSLVLCRMQDRVRSIFQIARLETVFTIVDDTDAALSC